MLKQDCVFATLHYIFLCGIDFLLAGHPGGGYADTRLGVQCTCIKLWREGNIFYVQTGHPGLHYKVPKGRFHKELGLVVT